MSSSDDAPPRAPRGPGTASTAVRIPPNRETINHSVSRSAASYVTAQGCVRGVCQRQPALLRQACPRPARRGWLCRQTVVHDRDHLRQQLGVVGALGQGQQPSVSMRSGTKTSGLGQMREDGGGRSSAAGMAGHPAPALSGCTHVTRRETTCAPCISAREGGRKRACGGGESERSLGPDR